MKFTVIRHQSGPSALSSTKPRPFLPKGRYTYATSNMSMSLKEARRLASEVGGISVAASQVAEVLEVLNG